MNLEQRILYVLTVLMSIHANTRVGIKFPLEKEVWNGFCKSIKRSNNLCEKTLDIHVRAERKKKPPANTLNTCHHFSLWSLPYIYFEARTNFTECKCFARGHGRKVTATVKVYEAASTFPQTSIKITWVLISVAKKFVPLEQKQTILWRMQCEMVCASHK